MKSFLGVTVVTIALVSTPLAAHAATSAPSPSASTTKAPKQLNAKQRAAAEKNLRTVLYSVTADSGSLTPLPGVKDGYSLTLRSADPSTVWFTDRPYRDSGVLPTQVIAKSFAVTSDPANVALVLHEPAEGTDTLVAVMRKSAYDTKSQTLTAELRILSSQEQAKVTKGLSRHVKRADTKAPANFSRVSLFIDTNSSGTSAPSATYPPNPQVNDTYQWIGGGPWAQGPNCWTLYQYMGTSGGGWQAIGEGCPPPAAGPFNFNDFLSF